MRIETISHVGLVRTNNEDRLLAETFGDGSALLAIADGMGGHAAGEVAAQLAIEALAGFGPETDDPAADLVSRFEKAQHDIIEKSRTNPSMKGMGTTLTAIFISGASGFWAHTGDTRIYHFSEGSLARVTDDHTIPGMLLGKGEISKEQARLHPYGNVLTRCIGCGRYEPDTGSFDLVEGDLVLLSSDGLHDLISDERISAIMASESPIERKLDQMLTACLDAGGRDNITAVLARI